MALRRSTDKHGAAFAAIVLACAVSPFGAAVGQATDTFRIGIAARAGEPYRAARYEAFRLAAAKALDAPVEIVELHDATALIDAIATSRVEYAILSALGYATAQELCDCVEPLAAPVSCEGATAFRSILIADASHVNRAADLEGVTIGYGPHGSLSGDILPSAEFSWNGAPLARSGLDLVEIASAEDGLERLALGSISAMFAWEYVRPGTANSFDNGVQRYLDANSSAKFDVLWRSEPVQFGPHVVRADVPAGTRSALRRMLLALDRESPQAYEEVSPALGGGFVPVSMYDYRSALRLAKQISADAE